MFAPLERLDQAELAPRWQRCRRFLASHAPQAGGLMAFGRVNTYWLTGTMQAGVCWLPLEGGEPILLLRHGVERARLESPLAHILPFRSYRQVPELLAEVGYPLATCVAAEMQGLPWGLGQSLASHLDQVRFVAGDGILLRARSLKSPWELAKMRLAGQRHGRALRQLLPEHLRPGMSERQIAHLAWGVFFSLGHSGMMRMGNHGEEIFLGHVSAGDSANYPSSFDGPLGLRGEHPATPFMGYAGALWKVGQPLALDIGFGLEGYCTDMTQVYWAGAADSVPDLVRQTHDFCVDMQLRIAEGLRPGAIPSQLYAQAMERYAASGLPEGFMALAPNTVRFLGHGIGLVIDEFPVLAQGFDEPLEAGQVLAVEPKFGLPGLGMVGVENTFEVTDQGGVCLTSQEYDLLCIE